MRTLKRCVLLSLLVGLVTGLAPSGATSLAVAQVGVFVDSGQALTSSSGANSLDVALGDLDGDGDLDAFVAQGTYGTSQSMFTCP